MARLNQLAQQARINTGELDPSERGLRLGDQRLLVGGEVVTRRNNRRLRTDQELMVKNRDHWIIISIHRDGSITVAGRTGTIRLPADYMSRDLQLGYAQTSHASQGRTVDVALLLVDTPTDSRSVYTPMTRGREASHHYIVTDDNQTLSTCSPKPSPATGSTSLPSLAETNSIHSARKSLSIESRAMRTNTRGCCDLLANAP